MLIDLPQYNISETSSNLESGDSSYIRISGRLTGLQKEVLLNILQYHNSESSSNLESGDS
ncbi:MAG: hypothetical protein IAE90_08765, partial [Ignavibacteria bacterium]|nr:hypothetical protein [Ignavibacteria bacterium]